jgi:hypothetical protein
MGLSTRRSRGQEGMRMLCTSIREHDGRVAGEKSIRYAADRSVLGLAEGDEITRDAAAFRRLADAFLDELEARFPDSP